MAVEVYPDVMMSLGGTDEPCAQVTLSSIGSLGKSENVIISDKICNHLQAQIGVLPSRYVSSCTAIPLSQRLVLKYSAVSENFFGMFS